MNIDSKGLIVNTNYDVVEDKPVIFVYGRLENGKSFMFQEEFYPYFFIKEEDVKKAEKIINLNYEKTNMCNFNNEKVVKIILKLPKEVPVLRKLFEEQNIICYEADIPFTRRYLIDKKIQTSIKIKGEVEKGEFVDLVFKKFEISSISHKEVKNNLKLLAIDIETDKNAKEIYAISFYGDGVEKVFVVKNPAFEKEKIKNCYVFDNEESLLKAFYIEIKSIDSDLITGWNFIDFDLKVILEISKKYKIDFNLGRNKKTSSLRIESDFFRDSRANATGRVIIDGIALVKGSFINLENYKLNTAAKEILGKEKVNTSDDRTEFIEESYRKNPKLFVEYNLTDSKLVYEIFHKSNIFELSVQRSLLTGMHIDSISASIAGFDSVYLPKLHENKFVANSTNIQDVEQGLGGFVMKSKPGIYDNILVFDFKSLYPSIIKTFNIDPKCFFEFDEKLVYDIDTKVNYNKKYSKNEFIIAPNGTILSKKKGILPMLIDNYWNEREQAKKEKNELARYAIKILMNSMYGVLASPKSRYFNRYLSNAITYFAQFFIRLTMHEIEKDGYEVIYGDTDSVFVNLKENDTKKAVEIGNKIEKEINNFLENYISENYELKSELELEFEKTFVRFFMPTIRGSEEGAKKRYAGLKLVDGKTELDFTGLEFVRKDWTEVSKEFQLKLLDLVFENKSVDGFVLKFVNDLRNGKYDKLLIYKKSLSKSVDKYTKTTPPHVKAAKLLGDELKSRVIEYVITENGPEPIQKQKSKLDYEHYIDKQ
ncbi:MAG: DNA polymerase II, partial [Candidatus Woesearchaeota archaeon]